MLQRPALLLTILLALLAEVLSQPTLSDEQIQKQTRLQALATSILAQLGLAQPPSKPNNNLPVSPEAKEKFDLVNQVVNFMAQDQQTGSCQSSEFFAQTVTAFAGTLNQNFFYQSGRSTDERIRSIQCPSNLLNQFTLLFNFNLDSSLFFITQANLLLFQTPASNNDYVRDEEQYVEVKSIIPADSGRLTAQVIVGKFVNIFHNGAQLFDIKTAVEQWIAMGTGGEINLVISTYCTSPPLCTQLASGGKKVESIDFIQIPSSGEKAPRIILLSSTNPLENRSKRQTVEEGVFFCIEDQFQCCLKPFIINFVQDLGAAFSFIIDPPSYQANFCDGTCPTTTGGQLMVPSVFFFLSLLQNNPASSLTPCCAGHTYGSLPILIVNEEGIVEYKVLKNMKVLSCTCS